MRCVESLTPFLLAGSWRFGIYEAACAEALDRLSINVAPFAWNTFEQNICFRLEQRFACRGPASWRLNRALLRAAVLCRPRVVFIWRPTMIYPDTVQRLRDLTGATMVCYNNDDPFSPLYAKTRIGRRHWRFYHAGIPYYDLHFVYRGINKTEILAAGAKRVELLRSYFVPSLHRRVELSNAERSHYGCDVVFIGHYEADNRVDCIRALVKAGVRVKLFGGSTWTKACLGDLAPQLWPVRAVLGDEYTKALNGAQIALCFLSKLNRDTYTRRNFEIPACGTVMLSERTTELTELYSEDQEALFFSNKEELVFKAVSLLASPDRLRNVVERGLKRVLASGHSVDSRMEEATDAILSCQGAKTVD